MALRIGVGPCGRRPSIPAGATIAGPLDMNGFQSGQELLMRGTEDPKLIPSSMDALDHA